MGKDRKETKGSKVQDGQKTMTPAKMSSQLISSIDSSIALALTQVRYT